MRLFVRFILCLVISAGVLTLSLYTSCKKNNNCSGVHCQNKGTCSDGFCVCPAGVSGDTCQEVFKDSYANTYGGSASVNTVHIPYLLVFSIPATPTDFVTMALTVENGAGSATNIPTLRVVLNNPSETVSNFSIPTTTINGVTYSGNGTLAAKLASLTLYKTGPSIADTTYICNNFPAQ